MDGAAIENGTQYEWATGENVLTVTVTNGDGVRSESMTYTVTVSK